MVNFCDVHAVKRGVTAKQRRVLDFVKTFIVSNHYPPTVREIADALGIGSTNTVAHYLTMLQEYGLIQREPGIARGLTILEVGNVRDADQPVQAVCG